MTEQSPEELRKQHFERLVEAMNEYADSFTGHDEVVIAQHFGVAAGDLSDQNFALFCRAQVFVMERRAGASDDIARNTVMDMTNKAIQARLETLVDASGDVDAAGKDDELPVSLPVTSLHSAS